jgi:hypothetical protein
VAQIQSIFPIQNNRGTSITIIGAIDKSDGLRHYSIIKGSNNNGIFLAFLRGLIAKLDNREAVLVMDNLIIHKTKEVRHLISHH